MKPKLLIVDDDEEIRTQMKWGLAQDHDIVLAEDRATAVDAYQTHHPMVVLLDLGLPPRPGDPDEGLATLSDILSLERLAKVIVITGQAEKSVALRAIGSGAYDFLCKPADMEELKLVVRRALHIATLEIEFRQMQQLLSGTAFEGMMGNSRAIRAIFDAIRKVATTEAPVLLLGESGTGKEM
ncbi:MAG TPA: response regulator, partial [Candidatus Saccharimonadales bacterium]|nr:response regulator [Candidatus Saccharimonadales bacterium]